MAPDTGAVSAAAPVTIGERPAADATPAEAPKAPQSGLRPSSMAATDSDHTVAHLARQLDEAALLYATEQAEAAISVLHAALAMPLPPATDAEQRAWWMLLELHEALGQQTAFDRTALAYAQRFETSPPQWRPRATGAAIHQRDVHTRDAPTRAIPTAPSPLLRLQGSLDAGVEAMLAQWQRQHPMATELTLDLASVTAVALPGCHSLLSMLEACQQRGIRVQLRPCEAILTLLRTLIQSGRRDDDDAGWRLLIELLRLAGDVERYEDACLAYSLTYEVSPPAVAVPANVPAAAPATINDQHLSAGPPAAGRDAATNATRADRHATKARPASHTAFVLPDTITLPVDGLLVALRAHVRHAAADAPALVLDARGLQRIDFHAAAALQASLVELAAGKPVEWQGVSFLVSTLLRLSCGNTMPGIINRKP